MNKGKNIDGTRPAGAPLFASDTVFAVEVDEVSLVELLDDVGVTVTELVGRTVVANNC